MGQHSIIGFSGAYQWARCPASPVMSIGIPDPESDDDKAGTAVHSIAENMLTGRLTSAAGHVGRTAKNGVVITQEMADCAELYVRHIYRHTPKDASFNVEQRLLAARIHEQCWGTPDFWAYSPSKRTVYLRDYKHGHLSVDAYWNDQLICAAAAIMDQIEVPDTHLKFVMEIVQPRCYDGKGTVRGWTVNGAELRGRINQLNMAAHEALGANPQVRAGVHCRHCLARIRCPAHQQFGMDAADYAQSATPVEVDDASLAYEWSVIERATAALKYRREAIENEALARMRAGKQLPGLSQKQSMGHTKWVPSDADIIAMGDAMQVDLRAPEKPVTPTVAKDRVKAAKLPESVLSGLTHRPTGNVSVVIDDDAVIRSRFMGDVYYD